jgi:hypothetical protein
MARRRKYARGRRAKAICQRSGFKIDYKNLVVEPGTNLRVDKRMNDGRWNIVDHPLNYPPEDLVDEAPLRYATGDEVISQTSVFEVVLTDNDGNALADVSSNSLTGEFSNAFLLSYGTI